MAFFKTPQSPIVHIDTRGIEDKKTVRVAVEYADALRHLLSQAHAMGIVFTVETEPLEPFAMRNYRMVGRVRGAR